MSNDAKRIDKLEQKIKRLTEKISYYEDILKKEQLNQKLRDNIHESSQFLLKNVNDAVFVMTADKFVDCNSKTLEIFGCQREDIIDKSPVDFSPRFQPDGNESSAKAIQYIGSALGGEPQFFEWQHKKLDGTLIDCEVSLNRMELGNETYLQAIVRDISARKKAQRDLYERNLQYESLFRNSLVGIWRMEFTKPVSIKGQPIDVAEQILKYGYFSECNEALLSMYGVLSKEELVLQDLNIFGTTRDEALEYLEMFVYNNFSTVLLDSQGKDKNGKDKSFRFSYVGYVKDKILQWVWGIQIDLTEQKLLEKQFLQSQKMEAIGMLAGGIAHDFNNLLTVINGYSDLITNKINIENPIFKNVLAIRKAGEKAANLTSQLLAFSRRQILQPKIVYLNEIIEKMLKMISRLIGERISVTTELDDDLGRIKVDPVKVEQIIMNLALNARDAMDGKGELHFRTRNFTINKNFVKNHAGAKTGQYIEIMVHDTGAGIKPEHINNIFDPFFTTKDKATNTGLGLSTIYGIVKQSNGYIAVDSKPGKGTSFSIYLPRVEDTISIDDETSSLNLGANLKGDETLLIVEDAGNVREVIRESLEAYGYTILEAEDGEQALRIVTFHKGKINLVLTDVVMPKMDGKVFITRLKPILPDVKVIFMSGYTEDALVKKGEINSGIEFIQKPFNLVDLARRIRALLNSEQTN